MKKLACINLGCPKNQVDLEIILGGLKPHVQITQDITHADVVLVNTCAFIEPAKQESIDEILNIVTLQGNRSRRVVVSGCLPQRYKSELVRELPEVDAFYFSINPYQTLRELKTDLAFGDADFMRHYLTPSHYAYLQLSNGCNNRCSYCAIPLIKGDLVSREPQAVYREAGEMINRNVKELILVAQDITSYGADLSADVSLSDILQTLNVMDGVHWIRLLYTHPAHWTDRLIDVLADSEHIVP
ncbi:MAG: radical SAM protein [candidate division KSB1 bacterium]|nr:radical SAM protein [candidate division KSB1 bacterium]